MSFTSRWIGGLAAGRGRDVRGGIAAGAAGAQGRRCDAAQARRRRVGRLRPRLRRDASQPADADRPDQRQPARAWRGRSKSAPRARSRRRRSSSTACCTARRPGARSTRSTLRTGKLKWQWDPALVRGGFDAMGPRAVLRPGQSRRRALRRQGLRRPARRPAGRARRRDRRVGVVGADDAAGHATTRITGAPRIVKGKVVIGKGGGEYGVRGFLARLRRRRPASRRGGSTSSPAIRRSRSKTKRWRCAAKTWNGEWWKYGGGGTPWDGIAYDPEAQSRLRRHRQRLAVERATIAAPAAATTSTCRRSSRSTPTPASTSGTTRRRPATTGTTTPRSR